MTDRVWKVRYDDGRVVAVGYPFIFLSFLVAAFVSLFSPISAVPLWLLFVFTVSFFRNPQRQIPEDPQAIVSPADGKVLSIEQLNTHLTTSHYMHGPCQRVCIFMSPFNVHMNRIPFDGNIGRVVYTPGKYFAAFAPKASLHNEQNMIEVICANGEKILCVQIAGFIARRIVCDAQSGDEFKKGERYGFIRFGSRMDVYLPLHAKVLVKVGQKVKGGCILARF